MAADYILEERISIQLILNVKLEMTIQFEHETGSWRNSIAIKEMWRGFALLLKLFMKSLGIFGASEATCSLLVHFGARRNSIDR